jgi:hypothetical protein
MGAAGASSTVIDQEGRPEPVYYTAAMAEAADRFHQQLQRDLGAARPTTVQCDSVASMLKVGHDQLATDYGVSVELVQMVARRLRRIPYRRDPATNESSLRDHCEVAEVDAFLKNLRTKAAIRGLSNDVWVEGVYGSSWSARAHSSFCIGTQRRG